MQILKKAALAAATPIALSFLISFVPHLAAARQVSALCPTLFATTPEKHPRHHFVLADPYEQWLLWDEIANKLELRKPTTPIPFEVVRVSLSEVNVWRAPGTSSEIENMFVQGRWVIWPKHAYNQNVNVPFSTRPANSQPMLVRMTASRSVVPIENVLISIKTPTDHPIARDREPELEKIKTDEDIRDAILRYQHFAEVDRRLGPDPIHIKMFDVFAIRDKKTGIGILVRDISRLSDGNYHLPALSIPYVGREIAASNGADFTQFWAKHYAAVLGRAKARMLLRYGLQMDTPNAQNFLVPLNRELAPMGAIEARDLPDSYFVDPIAGALGFRKQVEADRSAGLRIDFEILPNWENSRFMFDRAGLNSIDQRTLKVWNHAHDMAYITEIEQTLGVTIVKNKRPRSAFRDYWLPWTPISQVQDFLVSPAGLKKLAEYAATNRPVP